MDERLDPLVDDLRDADRVVAFTGAGVSTASGIPSFRGVNGIWDTQFDPNDFRIGRFEADPGGFWQDRIELHEAMFPGDIAPNEAHVALTQLESAGVLDAVITQNTDGLHRTAGSENVIELHGNAQRVVCRGCGHRSDAAPVRRRIREGDVPPRCSSCDGLLKPDVVLFGERLPRATLSEAKQLAETSDVFLALGSSLTVEPAASLPVRAAVDGTLVVVNFDETPHDELAEHRFSEDVTDVLPALARRLVG